MVGKDKLATKRSAVVLCCILCCTLLLVLVVLSSLHSVQHQRVASSNDKQQQLGRQQLHGRTDLQHFSFMNETLSTLNHELRRIIEHRGSLQRTGSTGQNSAVDTTYSKYLSAVATELYPPPSPSSPLGDPGSEPGPGEAAVSPDIVPAVATASATTTAVPTHLRKKALLYTMDSISSYETNSKQGGASGELLIRHCLEQAFKELHVDLDVKTSDFAFESTDAKAYDIIILDPWTWAAPGWVPKKHIRGLDERIYILDFFGSKKLRGSGLRVPPGRFLTAFDTSTENTFLGYYINSLSNRTSAKKQQGVIWGKDTRHFEDRAPLLSHVANKVHLVSTATTPPFHHANIDWRGHQTSQSWLDILSESKFLIGLGDPLLGPSAIDAVATGCMFLNPEYTRPVHEGMFHSQHPYAAHKLGKYVCSYKINDQASLMKCIDTALTTDVPLHIPTDFTKEAYLQRVRQIFLLR